MNTAVLDQIATAFTAICEGSHAPTIPAIVCESHDPAGISEVGRILRHASARSSDRIWTHLVHQAREHGEPWTVIAAGLALPGLRHAADRVAMVWPYTDVDDGDAEILTGFLAALQTIDCTKGRICSRLCQAAFSAGRSHARRQISAARAQQTAAESRTPPPPYGHVDLVLARAVREQVITAAEADIIGAIRLDLQSVAKVAAAHGTTTDALSDQRRLAEAKLADWLAPN